MRRLLLLRVIVRIVLRAIELSRQSVMQARVRGQSIRDYTELYCLWVDRICTNLPTT